MVSQHGRNPAKMPPEELGKVLDNLNKKAHEAEEEAEGFEANAAALRCDAKKYRRQAEEILREKCPKLDLTVKEDG